MRPLPPPPQQARAGKQSGGSGHGDDGRPPVVTASGRRVGIVEKGIEISRAPYFSDLDQALLDPAPAFPVRMAERDVGIAGELARDLGLVASEAGRIGDSRLYPQFGEDARRDLVGMLQGKRPTFE